MSDFGRTWIISKTRTNHQCEQCAKDIPKGAKATTSKGLWSGYWYKHYEHPECHKAGREFARIHNLWEEDYPWFWACWQHEDDKWLIDNHPIAARYLLGDSEAIQSSIERHLKKSRAAVESLSQ